MTATWSAKPEGIRAAANALKNGDVVGMPTETVYGLAGNALSEVAVAKIFAAKDRPSFDPLIVHLPPESISGGLEGLFKAGIIADPAGLSPGTKQICEALMRAFWPGPLTLILPRGAAIPLLVTSGGDTVAVRVPSHAVAQSLLRECGFPLAAPSANRFGRISPTSAKDVVTELGGKIAGVLDGGQSRIGLESTVLRVDDARNISILRPGGITPQMIMTTFQVGGASQVSIRIVKAPDAPTSAQAAPASPGQLASHYAPKTRLIRLDHSLVGLSPEQKTRLQTLCTGKTVGLLSCTGSSESFREHFAQAVPTAKIAMSLALSESGKSEDAAIHLFSTLRELDASGADVLIASLCETEHLSHKDGLWLAITDRLSRASELI